MRRLSKIPTAWTLSLHGEPQLQSPVAPSVLLNALDAALLALLALQGPMPRARLAGLLWPCVAQATALTNLRQRLHRLTRRGGALLQDRGTGLLALSPQVVVPASPWTEGTGSSAAASDRDLPQFLGHHDYARQDELAIWVESCRQTDRDRRVEALRRAGAEAEAAGDASTAEAWARGRLRIDPLDEAASRDLMRLQHARGDIAGAAASYEHCRARLQQELGVRPSAATEQLWLRLRDAGNGGGVAGSPPLGPEALALWRLGVLAGERMSVALAERALGLPALRLVDAWQQLEQAGLLQGLRATDNAAARALVARMPAALAAHVRELVRCAPIAAPSNAGDGHAAVVPITPVSRRGP